MDRQRRRRRNENKQKKQTKRKRNKTPTEGELKKKYCQHFQLEDKRMDGMKDFFQIIFHVSQRKNMLSPSPFCSAPITALLQWFLCVAAYHTAQTRTNKCPNVEKKINIASIKLISEIFSVCCVFVFLQSFLHKCFCWMACISVFYCSPNQIK